MVKIYLNTSGSLVIDENNVIKSLRPTGESYGIYDFNNDTFGVSHDIQKELPLTEIKDENGDPYTNLEELRGAIDDFFAKPQLQHAGLDLIPAETLVYTDLTVAGQWYDIQGAFEMSITPKGFDVIGGVFTYIGTNNTSFRFVGSSDAKVSKNAELLYGLFINEEVEPRATSTHTFGTPNAFELMAITKYVELNKGDQLFVRALSNTTDTRLTPASLDTTFGGVS
jgi:hypothetical protein